MTAVSWSAGSRSSRARSVVLPLPRNPVTIETGVVAARSLTRSDFHEVARDDDLSREMLPRALHPELVGDARVVARHEMRHDEHLDPRRGRGASDVLGR